MRFGVCTSFVTFNDKYNNIDNIKLINDIGYDYVELPLAEINKLSNNDFQRLKNDLQGLRIKVEACNLLLPGNIKVVGEDIDYKIIELYLEQSMERAFELGVKVIVFGSGAARNVPVGWSRTKAKEQLVNFLSKLAKYAKKYGITITIEHLRSSECNIVNTVKEALELSKAVNNPNIKVLVDYYHLVQEKENLNIILSGRNIIQHIHIANGNNRKYPSNINIEEYREFFKALKRISYNMRISIEASTNDLNKESVEGLSVLKELNSNEL